MRATVRVVNLGTESGNWRCNINASDPSGSYKGVDLLESTIPLSAGESELYDVSLTITNNGAAYITEVTASNCQGS